MGPNNQNVKSTKFRLKSSMLIRENRSSAATYESKVMHPGWRNLLQLYTDG